MAAKKTGIGIIGYGYWGQNIVRNFYHTPGCEIRGVADTDRSALQTLARNYPAIPVVEDPEILINDNLVEAVVIATPVATHYALAKKALLLGKHVLVEKPVTTSVAEAEELMAIADEKGLVILVDHTFLYTSAVQKIRQLIDENTIGSLRYFDSTRINLGLFQPDVNVLWDLASHDIAILAWLVREKPVSVNATGISHTGNGIENIAYLTINYATDFIAHIHCSWTSPVKIRQTLIGGDKKMIIYNDLEPTEKIRIYDTSISMNPEDDKLQKLIDYRTGDITVPKIASREALGVLAADFVEAINGGGPPVSGIGLGLTVVRILEAAQLSIKSNGQNILLS
ncbi:MAG: Gfo/Idh/MocA family oxidoreductase [Chitinophagaceae bacterium]|nr:MAG: Gfo/Idh/MocA family oxidoreductase [Chitinophagaceae bacterium]